MFRVRFVDGQPIALMIENGHDTIYELRRASKQFKDTLFEEAEVSPVEKPLAVM